jgi:hypothetical protein
VRVNPVALVNAAAVAVVNLMQQTVRAIARKQIIAEFVKVEDEKPAARADALWDVLGEDAIKVMADGAICLAQLWDSAWKEGDGDIRSTITARSTDRRWRRSTRIRNSCRRRRWTRSAQF